MISAGEFRKGITFEMNGEPHVILDFQHVKPVFYCPRSSP